jgi:hypothetical protein
MTMLLPDEAGRSTFALPEAFGASGGGVGLGMDGAGEMGAGPGWPAGGGDDVFIEEAGAAERPSSQGRIRFNISISRLRC